MLCAMRCDAVLRYIQLYFFMLISVDCVSNQILIARIKHDMFSAREFNAAQWIFCSFYRG